MGAGRPMDPAWPIEPEWMIGPEWFIGPECLAGAEGPTGAEWPNEPEWSEKPPRDVPCCAQPGIASVPTTIATAATDLMVRILRLIQFHAHKYAAIGSRMTVGRRYKLGGEDCGRIEL